MDEGVIADLRGMYEDIMLLTSRFHYKNQDNRRNAADARIEYAMLITNGFHNTGSNSRSNAGHGSCQCQEISWHRICRVAGKQKRQGLWARETKLANSARRDGKWEEGERADSDRGTIDHHREEREHRKTTARQKYENTILY